jgi:hypothetical protein
VRVPAAAADTTGAAESDSSAALERFDLKGRRGEQEALRKRAPGLPPRKSPLRRSCSFWADNFDPNVVHLNARKVTFVAVSRARFAKLASYKERMCWSFKWVSSAETDFNFDYGVSFASADQATPAYNYGSQSPGIPEREGMSVFFKDESGNVFHTYSAYARGIDLLTSLESLCVTSDRCVFGAVRGFAAP